MQLRDFNTEGGIGKYGYQRSPVNERAFLILKKIEAAKEAIPVGDYTVLDKEEDIALAEKKVLNLIGLLNGRKNLMHLGHETKSRILYNIVNEGSKEEKAKVIFYHLGKEGVSKENALFTIERDEDVIE